MARFFHGMGTIMIASIDTLNRWAEKHRRETSAPPRAYTGPYPDLDGPTCAQMDAVQTAIDALKQEKTTVSKTVFKIEAPLRVIQALSLAARKGFDDMPVEKVGSDKSSSGFTEAEWTEVEEIITGMYNIHLGASDEGKS